MFSIPHLSVFGRRPTAISSLSNSISSDLPLASVAVSLTPLAVFLNIVGFSAGFDANSLLFEVLLQFLADVLVFNRNDAAAASRESSRPNRNV